mgnify:CR=1 FL=1|tara:strand:- start:177 stop:332 length:156 start_codon:yes stop_codon:yes gene_type:complete
MNCDLKDCVQVLSVNGGAVGLSFTELNEILTMVSLLLAIGFTIYKFVKFEK